MNGEMKTDEERQKEGLDLVIEFYRVICPLAKKSAGLKVLLPPRALEIIDAMENAGLA